MTLANFVEDIAGHHQPVGLEEEAATEPDREIRYTPLYGAPRHYPECVTEINNRDRHQRVAEQPARMLFGVWCTGETVYHCWMGVHRVSLREHIVHRRFYTRPQFVLGDNSGRQQDPPKLASRVHRLPRRSSFGIAQPISDDPALQGLGF